MGKVAVNDDDLEEWIKILQEEQLSDLSKEYLISEWKSYLRVLENQRKWEVEQFSDAANHWMKMYDDMVEKYEPSVFVTETGIRGSVPTKDSIKKNPPISKEKLQKIIEESPMNFRRLDNE